ncbi:MAG: TonB C-terminal domain-containing protein [Desulfamplus sp.]|nr:TonB C-terminal domain-containing protein [Desulfamplus sp.]
MNRLDFLKSISAASRERQVEASPSVKMMYGLSAALHGLLFLIVMFTQNLNPVPMVPFAVQVDLVSFSPGLPKSSSSSDNKNNLESDIGEQADSKSQSVVKKSKSGPKVKNESQSQKESNNSDPVKSLKKKIIKPDVEVKEKRESPLAETPKAEVKSEPKPESKPEVKTEPKPKPKTEPEPKPEPKKESEVVEKTETEEPVIAKKKESLKKKTYDSEKVEKSSKETVVEKETSKSKTVSSETTADSAQTDKVASKSSGQGTAEKEETSTKQGGVEKGKNSGNGSGDDTNKNSSRNSGAAGDAQGGDDSGDAQGKANLADALNRMKSKVASQSPKKGGGGSGTGSGGSSGAGAIASTGGQGSGTTAEAIGLYNLELYYKIRQNWSYNPSLAGTDGKVEVRIVIKILQNGEIRDIWFETHSGNSHLDESALKAVKKSNPLPPLPAGYTSYDIGLIFTPSGLK